MPSVNDFDVGHGTDTASRIGPIGSFEHAIGLDVAKVDQHIVPPPAEAYTPPPLVPEEFIPADIGLAGSKLYAEMEPMTYAEDQTQHSLEVFLGAIGAMFEEGWVLARDIVVDGQRVPGWSIVVDLNRTPNKALGWLAQFVGVTLDPALDDANQRTRIRETDGWKRGSPGAFMTAAKLYLTGQKTVVLRERWTSAYRILVITRTYETPDRDKVLSSLISQKPAGLILDYWVVNGRTYLEVRDENASYAAAKAKYGTYDGMRGTRQIDVPPTTPLAPDITVVPSSTLAPGG